VPESVVTTNVPYDESVAFGKELVQPCLGVSFTAYAFFLKKKQTFTLPSSVEATELSRSVSVLEYDNLIISTLCC
jgi:hypothetical protein